MTLFNDRWSYRTIVRRYGTVRVTARTWRRHWSNWFDIAIQPVGDFFARRWSEKQSILVIDWKSYHHFQAFQYPLTYSSSAPLWLSAEQDDDSDSTPMHQSSFDCVHDRRHYNARFVPKKRVNLKINSSTNHRYRSSFLAFTRLFQSTQSLLVQSSLCAFDSSFFRRLALLLKSNRR